MIQVYNDVIVSNKIGILAIFPSLSQHFSLEMWYLYRRTRQTAVNDTHGSSSHQAATRLIVGGL